MKLRKVPMVDGRKDFSGINVRCVYASEREFAGIIGASKSQVHKLKLFGVLDNVAYEGLNLYRNLRSYRRYLQLHERAGYDDRLRRAGYGDFISGVED